MIIDYTYFTGLLSVGISPDTGASSLTRDAEHDRLHSYIEVYENEYLMLILGEDMYHQFSDYITNRKESIEKWEKLYEALAEKYSPIACYVFFKLISECNYSVTRSGISMSSDEDTVSPIRLQIRVWNDMVNFNKRIYNILKDKEYNGVVFDMSMLEKINDMGI